MTRRRPPNIVFVLSDEHAAEATGCYGHRTVRTPNLDRLAARGTLYENAYCSSPMCVPSRLSLLSGRHVHQIGAWDNGVIPAPGFRTWAHHLRSAGYESVLAGRTHFNGADRLLGFDQRLTDDLDHWTADTGRPPNRVPGWRRGSNSHVTETGMGEHAHTSHDVETTDRAVEFLTERARRPRDHPFLMYVGYMHPHFPLVAPERFLDLYDPSTVSLPPTRHEDPDAQHPVIAAIRHAFHNDEPLSEEQERLATACYWALVSHLDHQIGRLVDAVDHAGLGDDTVIVYTSDHGEMAGHHGIWQKQVFYEPAVRVPLIVRPAGRHHGTPSGTRVRSNVSLVDVLPTLRDVAALPVDHELPGTSLLSEPLPMERPILSEYHAQGMVDAGFMLKRGRYKYCHYVGHPPQLFDVEADPLEKADLAADLTYAGVLAALESDLAGILDPIEVDRRAKDNQRRRADQAATSPACTLGRGR